MWVCECVKRCSLSTCSEGIYIGNLEAMASISNADDVPHSDGNLPVDGRRQQLDSVPPKATNWISHSFGRRPVEEARREWHNGDRQHIVAEILVVTPNRCMDIRQ